MYISNYIHTKIWLCFNFLGIRVWCTSYCPRQVAYTLVNWFSHDEWIMYKLKRNLPVGSIICCKPVLWQPKCWFKKRLRFPLLEASGSTKNIVRESNYVIRIRTWDRSTSALRVDSKYTAYSCRVCKVWLK